MIQQVRSRVLKQMRSMSSMNSGIHSKYNDNHSKQKTPMNLYSLSPELGYDGFMAPNTIIAGEVELGQRTVVFYNSVLRGDLQSIVVGDDTIINDNCVISTCGSLVNGQPSSVSIGSNCYIGSHTVIYSAKIDNNCYIGSNSIILEGAIIEEGSIIGPNSVVPPGRVIPAHQLWGGNPVQYQRDLEKSEIMQTINTTNWLQSQKGMHKYEFIPFRSNYLLKPNDSHSQQIGDHLVAKALSTESYNKEKMLNDIYN